MYWRSILRKVIFFWKKGRLCDFKFQMLKQLWTWLTFYGCQWKWSSLETEICKAKGSKTGYFKNEPESLKYNTSVERKREEDEDPDRMSKGEDVNIGTEYCEDRSGCTLLRNGIYNWFIIRGTWGNKEENFLVVRDSVRMEGVICSYALVWSGLNILEKRLVGGGVP